MTIKALKSIFHRDLLKLKTEIETYSDEDLIWKVDGNIHNSAGNLCLHLIGNLNAYIGVGLLHKSYVRDRSYEFSATLVPRYDLLLSIDATIEIVEKAMDQISNNDLSENFPINVWEEPSNMAFTLIHLATHLNYHLGQINYHRRMIDLS